MLRMLRDIGKKGIQEIRQIRQGPRRLFKK